MKKLNSPFIIFVLFLMLGAISIGTIDYERGYQLLSDPVTWLVLVAAFFLLMAFGAVFKAMDTMRWLVMKKEGKLPELVEEEDEAPGFFETIWQKLQDSRPIEEEAEIDLDHNYDGIRELDNNLPPWWVWGFYITIGFAVVYLFRYHVSGSAPLSAEEYRIEMTQAAIDKEEYLKNAANLVDENSVTALTEESALKDGQALFMTNCAVCHAKDGGGGVGPNLVDQYWIHGGSISDVFSTIKYGVPAKGMIPWKDQLGASDMQKLASYILSIQGNPAENPKEAQGELYEPES